MNPQKRLALVLAFVVCILLVVSLFPAADPRVEVPGAGSGDWESLTETPESETVPQEHETGFDRTDAGDSDRDGSETDTEDADREDSEMDIEPQLHGEAIPGRTATVGVDPETLEASGQVQATLLVNGERVGVVAGNETTRFEVPVDADELNVSVEETGESVTLAVDTDVAITAYGAPIPDEMVELEATVGEQAFSNAAVLVDGEEVTTTNHAGNASVHLPETAGETEIRVEDGGASGTHTVDVGEPSVEFNSLLMFPGTPTTVSVSVGDAPVENATVTLGGGSETTTDSGGSTWVTLPVADEVTVTAEVGAEQTSTTVSNLYLRTTLVVLGIPGLIIGGVWTYLRYAPDRWRRRHDLSGVFLSFAGLLANVAALWSSVRRIRPRWPSGLRLNLSRLSFGSGGLGGLSLSLPSFAALFSSVSSPKLPVSGWRRATGGQTSGDTDDSESDAMEGADTGEDPEELPEDRDQLRAVWHTFLDHLGVGRRETLTPGEASRRAIAAGYPARSVRRLLDVFRDVEYGGTPPTLDEVSVARSNVETLVAHDPEDGSESDSTEPQSERESDDSGSTRGGEPR